MRIVSRGFEGRRREPGSGLLPRGQYVVDDFPMLSAWPTPSTPLEDWDFTIVDETGSVAARWTWEEFRRLPAEAPTVDIHCVTKWSKLGTRWVGVSVDTLLDGIDTSAEFVLAFADGGYTTNLPLADVQHGQAPIVRGFQREELEPEHGGSAVCWCHTYTSARAAQRPSRPAVRAPTAATTTPAGAAVKREPELHEHLPEAPLDSPRADEELPCRPPRTVIPWSA